MVGSDNPVDKASRQAPGRHNWRSFITLRQLRYFVLVAELGSITGAAASLNVAQTALGMQIRLLEESLKVALLVRHARGVRLTKAGETLHRRAVKILDDVAGANREIAAMQGKDTIRLGLTPSLRRLLEPRLDAATNSVLPNIEIQIVQDFSLMLGEKLKQREIDVALAYEPDDSREILRQKMCEEDLFLVSAAEAARQQASTIRLSEALEFDLVVQRDQGALHKIISEAARAAAMDIRIRYWTPFSDDVVKIVSCGLASAILPASLIAQPVAERKLSARLIEQPKLVRNLYLIRRRNHDLTDNDRQFDAFLEQMFRDQWQSWFHPIL